MVDQAGERLEQCAWEPHCVVLIIPLPVYMAFEGGVIPHIGFHNFV